jgi:hypothetical protein
MKHLTTLSLLISTFLTLSSACLEVYGYYDEGGFLRGTLKDNGEVICTTNKKMTLSEHKTWDCREGYAVFMDSDPWPYVMYGTPHGWFLHGIKLWDTDRSWVKTFDHKEYC